MNVIKKLTLRYMSQNKKRTLVTVMGTIVSVAMITAVAVIAASFMDLMQRTVIETSGKWQIQIENIPGKNLSSAFDQPGIDAASAIYESGLAKLPQSADSRRGYLLLTQAAGQIDVSYPVELEEGRFAQNSSELVISREFLNTSGNRWGVGDRIKLETGRLFVDYEEEDGEQVRRILGSQDALTGEEQWESAGEKEYTIVGIARMGQQLEPTWRAWYTGLTAMEETLPEDSTLIMRFWIDHPDKTIYRVGENLQNRLGANVLSYNNQLLFYAGLSNNAELVVILTMIIGIISTVILVGSVSLIYNAFCITLSERSRTLGMLASVGATKRQKRGSVFFEAAVIGIISIPLGVLFGILGIGITFALINPVVQGVFSTAQTLSVVLPVPVLLAAVAFSVVVLFVSAWIPARRASRITPIEAIRGNQELKISARQIRTSSVTRKIFGFEAELGLKNIKRSKNRYRATLFSLIISVVLFLTASTFTFYLSRTYEMAQTQVQFDIACYFSLDDVQQRQELVSRLSEAQGSDGITVSEEMYFFAKVPPGQLSPAVAERMKNWGEKNAELMVHILSLDDAALKEFGEEAKVAVEELHSNELKGILISPITLKEGSSMSEIAQLREPVGTTLHLLPWSAEGARGEIQIIAQTPQVPTPVSNIQEDYKQVYLVTSQQALDAWYSKNGEDTARQYVALFLAKQPTDLYNNLSGLSSEFPAANMNIFNMAENRGVYQQMMIMASVFLYGFVALITMVCTANIFNTISTGVALRSREFAMLYSVGISPKKFDRMLRYESWFYGMKALLYGLPISVLLGVWIYNILQGMFSFPFSLPLGNYLAAVAGVFLLVSLTMWYSVRKVKRADIMDVLKNENL